MSETQDGTVEPFRLYDPTKVDQPLAAADVQSLIDASITAKFDAFRAELLQVLAADKTEIALLSAAPPVPGMPASSLASLTQQYGQQYGAEGSSLDIDVFHIV